MNDHIVLFSEAIPGVSLRSAVASDCESLRSWKNDNRQFFFHQDVITPEAQRAWFDHYSRRADDCMFIVQTEQVDIGCIGVRQRDGQADIYNVILGRTEFAGRGIMRKAMQLVCSEARERFGGEIVARVLRNNPALTWYLRHGFEIASEADGYVLIRLATDRFSPVAIVRRELVQ